VDRAGGEVARESLREAQAALGNARAQFERSKQLAAQKFISASALDKAEAEYKAAQARVGALLGRDRAVPQVSCRPLPG